MSYQNSKKIVQIKKRRRDDGCECSRTPSFFNKKSEQWIDDRFHGYNVSSQKNQKKITKLELEIMQSIIELNENPTIYIFGGFLRDFLLKMPASDIDFAANISYKNLKEHCEKLAEKYQKLGKKVEIIFVPKMKMVTLVVDDISMDIKAYDCISELKADRPDNALLFCVNKHIYLTKENIIDRYDAKDLLDKKKICTLVVVDGYKFYLDRPYECFKDDPIRIIRFLSTLAKSFGKLSCDKTHKDALVNCIPLVQKHKKLCRVFREMNKFFLNNAEHALDVLEELAVEQRMDYKFLLKCLLPLSISMNLDIDLIKRCLQYIHQTGLGNVKSNKILFLVSILYPKIKHIVWINMDLVRGSIGNKFTKDITSMQESFKNCSIFAETLKVLYNIKYHDAKSKHPDTVVEEPPLCTNESNIFIKEILPRRQILGLCNK